MSKLSFRYGVMGSGKSDALIGVANNYKKRRKKTLVLLGDPTAFRLEDALGRTVSSRNGLSYPADMIVNDGFICCTWTLKRDLGWPAIDQGAAKYQMICLCRDYDCVLVDEAQFLHPDVVDLLRQIASSGTPVICYGLRSDFRSNLFPGSKRLFEVADSIEEVKTTCARCSRKATQNKRLVASQEQILIGGDDYEGVCWAHFGAGS